MTERILVGIASGGSPTQPFLESFAALTLPDGVEPLGRSLAFGNYVPAQRELIAQDAIDGRYDYLLFVDDDMILPPDALERLLETMHADPRCGAAGALYWSRDGARPIAVADWDSNDTSSAKVPAYTTRSTDLVDGIGFGCALIRVSALIACTPPYFPAHVLIDQTARIVRLCDEDYVFCERVRSAGWHVRLDARVRCGHYDRQTRIVQPERWETDAESGCERMIVQQGTAQVLVPFDDRVERVRERHTAAGLVYISV